MRAAALVLIGGATRVPEAARPSSASVSALGHVERISTDVEGQRAGAQGLPPWRGGGGVWGRQRRVPS